MRENRMEEILKYVGAFMDILILASGYQSNGNPALWTPHHITRALGWALLIEESTRKLYIPNKRVSSIMDLDAAIKNLCSQPSCPLGICDLSSESLLQAIKVLIKTMVHAPGVANGQLEALVEGVNGFVASATSGKIPQKGSTISVSCSFEDLTRGLGKKELDSEAAKHWLLKFTSEQILERYSSVFCLESLAAALGIAKHAAIMPSQTRDGGHRIWKTTLCSLPSEHGKIAGESKTNCDAWRDHSLQYMLNSKTIYKLSGAVTIFNTAHEKWRTVLDILCMESSGKRDINKVLEVAELCCLLLAHHNWNNVTYRLLSLKCLSCSEIKTTSAQWHLENPHLKETLHSVTRVSEVQEYFQDLIFGFENLLLKLPPILVASALLNRSPLLQDYLHEILKELETDVTHASYSGETDRIHPSTTLERLWCLKIVAIP